MYMLIALALMVAGMILLIFGLNASDSIQDSFSRLFTGRNTDRTVWLIVGGSICFILGLFGCYSSRRI